MTISTYTGGVNRENNQMELKKKHVKRKRKKKVLIKGACEPRELRPRHQRDTSETPEQEHKPERSSRGSRSSPSSGLE